MKKLVSIVLALCMIVSLAPTFAFAEEAAPAETLTLIDFGNPESFEPAICEHPTAVVSAFAYEGKSSSLKYVMNNWDVNIPINTTERDLSGYNTADTTINIRFYSEAVGSRFNIIYVNTDDSTKYSPAPSNSNRLTITGGWQTFTVPFSSVYEKTGNKITVRLNDFGWGNETYNQGDVVYVDSIWLDSTAEYDSMKDSDSLVVWDPEKGDYDITNVGKNILDPYGARGIYRHFETLKTLTVFKRDLNREFTADDASTGHNYTPIFSTEGYTYLNAWVYSPEPQDSGFRFRLNSLMTSTDSLNNFKNGVKMTGDEYFDMDVPQVDWKGWKLISVPIPADKDKDIIAMTLYVAYDGPVKHNFPENNIPLKVGFDGIWLSKGETSPQSEWEASKTYGKIDVAPYKASDIPVADFNTPSKLPGGLNIKITNDNPHIYDTAVRMTWNTAPDGEFEKITLEDRKSQVDLFGTDKNSTNTIKVNDNSYINLWMYNPEIKYAMNGTDYAEFNLVLCYWDGSNTVRKPICIMANWTGWKLISIPVSVADNENSGAFVKNGINYIYLGANIGWYNVASTRSDAQKADGYVFGYANHYVATYSGTTHIDYDRKNFMDVERVWISNGPVEQGVDMTKVDNSTKICPESAYDVAQLFTTEDEFLSVNARTVKTADAAASVPDVTYIDGVLVFNEGLGYDEKYSVAVEIYAADGVKYVEEFNIQSENYHVMKYETANSISVSMHGNVPWDYSGAIMVAAVYDKNSNEMLSMTPAYVDDNMTVNVKVDDFDEATQKIKFIFINNFEQIKPLYKEIIA